MKRKLIVAAAVFVAALFVNVYFSTIVFQLISKSYTGFGGISLFIEGVSQPMVSNR